MQMSTCSLAIGYMYGLRRTLNHVTVDRNRLSTAMANRERGPLSR